MWATCDGWAASHLSGLLLSQQLGVHYVFVLPVGMHFGFCCTSALEVCSDCSVSLIRFTLGSCAIHDISEAI